MACRDLILKDWIQPSVLQRHSEVSLISTFYIKFLLLNSDFNQQYYFKPPGFLLLL